MPFGLLSARGWLFLHYKYCAPVTLRGSAHLYRWERANQGASSPSMPIRRYGLGGIEATRRRPLGRADLAGGRFTAP